MIFEIGKQYIVSVTENRIIPIEEFSEERYFDIEHDSIDFLTDEEKAVVINDVLDKIIAEIETDLSFFCFDDWGNKTTEWKEVKAIINKYKTESKEGVEE